MAKKVLGFSFNGYLGGEFAGGDGSVVGSLF
jgi:hypothetical protein